jgi:aspartyl-tRNA synthetase
MNFTQRTHTCGDLRITNEGKPATLNGWIYVKRDLGGLLFIDLRDRYGITQLKISPDNKEIYDTANKLSLESVISVTGTVIKRESVNNNIPTGEIELDVEKLEVLNESAVTPFVIEEDVKASDDLRLKYRYLDMRRESLMKNLLIRSKVYQSTRKYFEKLGFIEIETPVLMKSTPEGARDYLVPSRVHKGSFYALPQSPQIYKQILMVAGFDKYIQICKCFRDEDLRADRQPEFSQIDFEMSFVKQEDVFEVLENLFKALWKDVLDIDIELPITQMSYDEVMRKYGSDKPDLRIPGMEIRDCSGELGDCDFKVFTDAIKEGGVVAGIKLEGQETSRKTFDELTEYAKNELGFGGLAYIKFNADGEISSPIKKFISDSDISQVKFAFSANENDVIFFLSGDSKKVHQGLGKLRVKLAEDFKLIDESKFEFLIVKDFPLFSYDEESGGYVAEHHMFTMPWDEHLKYLKPNASRDEVESIRAYCYDVVLNGNEITSGSIRVHRPDIQQEIFDKVGFSAEEAEKRFGFMLEAFKYGAPPHGGAAVGIDRVVAIMCGIKSLRDVIAFPKTINAASPMDESPSTVDESQLKDLGIELAKN